MREWRFRSERVAIQKQRARIDLTRCYYLIDIDLLFLFGVFFGWTFGLFVWASSLVCGFLFLLFLLGAIEAGYAILVKKVGALRFLTVAIFC